MQQIQTVKLKQDYMLAASLEDEAVLQLLRLGELDPVLDNYMPLQERLNPNAPRHKPTSNSSLHAKHPNPTKQPPPTSAHATPIRNTTQRWKGKSQTEPSSLEHSAASSQNKENLKKLLEKLERSPSPTRKAKPKQQYELIHIKTEKTEPPQRRKSQPIQTAGPHRRSLERLFLKDKNRDFIKNLVKAKIVEKMRSIEMRKTEGKNQKGRISTLRDLHGTTMRKALKPSYGLLAEQERASVGLMSGKNSRIHLNQLLF